MPKSGLRGILCPVFLWLPVTFAIWYFCGPLLAVLVASVLDLLLPQLTDGRISAVEPIGEMIQAVVVLGEGSYKGLEVPAGQSAELLIQSRPMIYAYGIPVFLALAFAADARCDISRNILGMCIVALIAVAVFGAGMDVTKTIFLNLPVDVSRTSDISPLQASLIALGYQFGVLILPMVVPVLLGCWLCASWFRSIIVSK